MATQQKWEKYMYDFPEGVHSFKWEFFSSNYARSFAGLDAIFLNKNRASNTHHTTTFLNGDRVIVAHSH
jgi:hypothetical protein